MPAGNYTLAGTTVAQGKTFTIKGNGANSTTFITGNGSGDGNQGQADTSMQCAEITFWDMSFKQYDQYCGYNGFMNLGALEFHNCTFEDGYTYWADGSGSKKNTNKFYDCTFRVEGRGNYYDVPELRSSNDTSYYFKNCHFYSDWGKYINAYKQGGASTTIYITIEGCDFHNTGNNAGKAAVNLKTTLDDGCNVSVK